MGVATLLLVVAWLTGPCSTAAGSIPSRETGVCDWGWPEFGHGGWRGCHRLTEAV